MQLSAKVRSIKQSPTLQLDSRAKELIMQGKDIISFGAGEPDFPSPPEAKEGCLKAIEEGKTRYTPADGIRELKVAVAEKFEKFFGPRFSPDEVVVTSGAKMAIWATLFSLVDEGDEVIILSPYWVSYTDMVLMCGGVPKVVRTYPEREFLPDPADIESAIGPRTKGIILNFPSNPTGAVIDEKLARDIAQIAYDRDLFVISDEIYATLTFDGGFFSMANIDKIRDRLIVIWGVSKTYAMTGWRIGFALCPTYISAELKKILSQTTSNPSTPAQYAAVEVLKRSDEFVKRTTETFRRRRDLIFNLITSIKGVRCVRPRGAFYIFPDFSAFLGGKVKDTNELCDYLLERGVLVIPGEAFGYPGFARLTFALDEERIKEGVKRIAKALEELGGS